MNLPCTKEELEKKVQETIAKYDIDKDNLLSFKEMYPFVRKLIIQLAGI